MNALEAAQEIARLAHGGKWRGELEIGINAEQAPGTISRYQFRITGTGENADMSKSGFAGTFSTVLGRVLYSARKGWMIENCTVIVAYVTERGDFLAQEEAEATARAIVEQVG